MSKATTAQIALRVEEVLRIRLDGAEFWDVREYAREKEKEAGSAWTLPEDGKPLSDGQLWRYIAQADKLIAESCHSSRKKLLRNHLAVRRNLYAKCVSAGDYKAALACKRDEAELLGLYPATKQKIETVNQAPMVLNVVETIVEPGHAAAEAKAAGAPASPVGDAAEPGTSLVPP
jgi:hypothetical protein